MKKKIKLFITFLFATALFFVATTPFNTVKATTFGPMILLDGEPIEDQLNFELRSNDGSNQVITSTSSEDSYIDFHGLKDNVSYSVKLLSTEKYTFDTFSFTIKDDGPHKDSNDELVLSLDIKNKPKQEKPIEKEKSVTFSPMVLLDGQPLEEQLDFQLTSNDGKNQVINAKSDGEGYIDFHGLKENTSYSVKLLDNKKYDMTTFSLTLKDGAAYRDSDNEMILSLDINKKVEKRTSLYLSILDNHKQEIKDELNFELKSSDETLKIKSSDGQISAKLKDNTSYTLKLLDTSNYSMDSFSFTIKKGDDSLSWPYRDDSNELLVSANLQRLNDTATEPEDEEDCGCDDSNQKRVTIKQMGVVDSKNPKGPLVKEELTFIFFNISKQKHAGEYTTKNGKLPEIELLSDDEYEVYLKENDSYGMKRKHLYAFLSHFPIDMDDEHERWFDKFEVIKKDENYVEPKEELVPTNIYVLHNGKIVKEEVTLEFISDEGSTLVTSKDGIISTSFRENVDYMVGLVNNDKYDMETFPLVIKNKGIGKFPYDHRTCNLVEAFNLVNKGEATSTNPRNTIEDSKKTVRVTGINFADLKLEVEKLDASKIAALNGKSADVYDIRFKNIYRNEIVKLPAGNYTVTIPKQRGKKAVAVYYVTDKGTLESREIIEGINNSVVTFKTTHFSRYAVEYAPENKDNNSTDKPKVDGEANKPSEPKVDNETNKPSEPKADGETNKPSEPKVDNETNKPSVPKNDNETNKPSEPKVDNETNKPSEPKVDNEANKPFEFSHGEALYSEDKPEVLVIDGKIMLDKNGNPIVYKKGQSPYVEDNKIIETNNTKQLNNSKKTLAKTGLTASSTSLLATILILSAYALRRRKN